MTSFSNPAEIREVLGGFLERFPGLDPILREAMGQERMVMKVELSEPEFFAEIDTTTQPLTVRLDSRTEGMIGMSGRADHFHDLLLGRMALAVAINQKKLLVRGSAAKLMKSAPLFYLAPYLYPFYLESIGRADLIGNERRPLLHGPLSQEDPMTRMINGLAYLTGYLLGLVKKYLTPGLNIVSVLESLGRGLARASRSRVPEK